MEKIPGLYVDKDWGQFALEIPPVNWPCALIDIGDIAPSQRGAGGQITPLPVKVTVGGQRLASSTPESPNREAAYKTVELIEQVHEALQMFTGGDYAPLVRASIKKLAGNSSKEAYELIYDTAYDVSHTDPEATTTKIRMVKLEVQ